MWGVALLLRYRALHCSVTTAAAPRPPFIAPLRYAAALYVPIYTRFEPNCLVSHADYDPYSCKGMRTNL
jgi:hypothetical protein